MIYTSVSMTLLLYTSASKTLLLYVSALVTLLLYVSASGTLLLYAVRQRHFCFASGNPMLQTLTLGHKPLTLTPIYRSHIRLHLTHSHNTFFLCYFLPTLQTQTFCHILSLILNMSSLSINCLVHYNGQIIKIDEGDMFQCPYPMLFQTKRGLTLEALKRKIHKGLQLQPLDQVCDISF